MGLGVGGIRRSFCAALLVLSLLPWAPAGGRVSDPDQKSRSPAENEEIRASPQEPDSLAQFAEEDSAINPYWIGASLVVVGSAALFADGSIKNYYQSKIRGETTDNLADAVRGFGDGLVLTGLMGAGYLTGRILDDDRASQASLTAFQSFIAAGALTEGIKLLARRDRPNQSSDPYAFNGPGAEDSGKSFISGHATHAFAAATAVALAYEDEPLVAPVAYGIASLTALSRVNDNRHWASDVLLGSAMGYMIGNLVHGFNRSFWSQDPDLSVRPLVKGDTAGIIVTLRF